MSLTSFFPVISLSCFILAEVSAHQNVALSRGGNTNATISSTTFFEATTTGSSSSSQINNIRRILSCNGTDSELSVELKTDLYPGDTSWEVIDVGNNKVVHSVERGDYLKINTLYKEALCIPSERCYQFMLSYGSRDNLLFDTGYYKIFYENEEAIVRNYQETSIYFGDGCPPSQSPTSSISDSPPSFVTSFATISLCTILLFGLIFGCVKSINITQMEEDPQSPQVIANNIDKEKSRRLKIVASIIHKKVLSKTKVTEGNDEDPGKELVLPHKEILLRQSLRLSAASQLNSSVCKVIGKDADENDSSSVFPIAIPEENGEVQEQDELNKDNNNDEALPHSHQRKDDIYLASLRQSQKSSILSNRSSLYSPKSCSICLDEYKVGDEIAWSKNDECPHAFHLECIVDWLMKSDDCPLCRGDYLHAEEKC